MTVDAAYLELLASYEAALEASSRSVTIARTLIAGLLNRQHPPDDVVRAYNLQIERDEALVAELRGKARQFKATFKRTDGG